MNDTAARHDDAETLAGHDEGLQDAVGHVVSMKVLGLVIVALLVLTGVTVAATHVQFGPVAGVAVALSIAAVKASLVALYFMHLRYDNLLNGVVLICALLFVALFIVIALKDTKEYQPDVIWPVEPPPSVAGP